MHQSVKGFVKVTIRGTRKVLSQGPSNGGTLRVQEWDVREIVEVDVPLDHLVHGGVLSVHHTLDKRFSRMTCVTIVRSQRNPETTNASCAVGLVETPIAEGDTLSGEQLTRSTLRKATRQLTAFVGQQAYTAARHVGFGWVPVPNAPSTYPALRAAFTESRRTGKPMPISSRYCESVIYHAPETNHAVRFWHDTLHVQTGLTFNVDDELELGLLHLRIAEANGIKKNFLAWRILRIDMLGQNYLIAVAKRFPVNQADFVRRCIVHGLDEGLLQEIRLQPQDDITIGEAA